MKFPSTYGWTIAAFASAVASIWLMASLGRFGSIIMPICFFGVIWKNEKHFPDHRGAKKLILLSVVLSILTVMEAKAVEDYMQVRAGISGYGAAALLIAPLMGWYLWKEFKLKMAEDAARNVAVKGSVA